MKQNNRFSLLTVNDNGEVILNRYFIINQEDKKTALYDISNDRYIHISQYEKIEPLITIKSVIPKYNKDWNIKNFIISYLNNIRATKLISNNRILVLNAGNFKIKGYPVSLLINDNTNEPFVSVSMDMFIIDINNIKPNDELQLMNFDIIEPDKYYFKFEFVDDNKKIIYDNLYSSYINIIYKEKYTISENMNKIIAMGMFPATMTLNELYIKKLDGDINNENQDVIYKDNLMDLRDKWFLDKTKKIKNKVRISKTYYPVMEGYITAFNRTMTAGRNRNIYNIGVVIDV